MNPEEKCLRRRFPCVSVAPVLPERSPTERAAFAAFALAKAEAARPEMDVILRPH